MDEIAEQWQRKELERAVLLTNVIIAAFRADPDKGKPLIPPDMVPEAVDELWREFGRRGLQKGQSVSQFHHTTIQLESGSRWLVFWELFQYCLPKRTRQLVYEPGWNELLEDHFRTRQLRTSWPARCWLNCSFSLRTALLVADCWQAILRERFLWVLGVLASLGALKRWLG